MTDDIDRAQEREAQMLSDALRDQAHRARKGLGAVSAQECGACGEPIPEERRAVQPGCQYCVACQARAEKTNKGAKAR